jgi:hypothetical protein
MKRSFPAALLALAAVVSVAASCARRGDPVASLIESQGTVERSDGSDTWTGVAPGFAFIVGDALKTSAHAQARLRLTNGTVIRVLENARIRFARGTLPAAKGPNLNVELGSAEVESAVGEIALVTALGVARIERGARVRVSSDGARSTLEVVVGRAVLLAPDGELTVDQGKGVRLASSDSRPELYEVVVGAPIAEVAPPPPSAAPEPRAEAAPEPRAEAAPESPTDDGSHTRAPTTRADATLEAGDGGTIHFAERTLALRLTFEKLCSGEAAVEVKDSHGSRVLTGGGAVVLKLHPGALRYTLRCSGDRRGAKPRASGALTIKRDSGDIAVSRRAPVNVLDADGRRYTVLFQTRPPALTLGWAGAPATATGFSLHVESAAGPETFATSAPSWRLASGTLAEGSYVWWYATADGRTSPKTTVTIRFDNAAPTAQFFPRRSGGEPGPGSIAVDGVTIDGAKVSVGGQSLPVDERGRFRAIASPVTGDDAVVVRLEHPRTGIHYYVRPAGARRHARIAQAR